MELTIKRYLILLDQVLLKVVVHMLLLNQNQLVKDKDKDNEVDDVV